MLFQKRITDESFLKPFVFSISCLPLFYLLFLFFSDSFGANPIEETIRLTGLWSYRFLILTLSISFICEQFLHGNIFFLRRLFGLFTFFYGSLHFSAYLILDQYFDWQEIWLDIKDRPFITSGFMAFILLLPLAASSNSKAIEFLGALLWHRLHKLVYVIALCSLLHYFWMVKLTGITTFFYLLSLTILLIYRIPFIRGKKWFIKK